MKNKKAISIMVAYVLLIIIAITLSIFVYNWLKKYVPKDTEKCEAEVSLIIEKYSCTKPTFSITVKNAGNFNINGFYLRVSSDGVDIYSDINEGGTYLISKGQAPIVNKTNNNLLKPQGEYELKNIGYPIGKTGNPLDKISHIEVEPYLLKKGKVVLCGEALVRISTDEESGCL